MGPAKGGEVSDAMLDKLATLSTQSLIDGLWVMGWPSSFIEGARPLAKGHKCAGRAVTLRFVPHRPDVAADKPIGVDSPEYEAFELCGPREVLVMASVGPWESVGGDIKFLRLKQRQVGGLVTDGSVRDTDELINYGLNVFSYSTTAKQGPAIMQPWECNGVMSCGGVVVRPGDAIIGDQDGVVVVPAAAAEKVYEIAHGREEIENIIKDELIANPGPPGARRRLAPCRALACARAPAPRLTARLSRHRAAARAVRRAGRYYPFKPPIKPESPLGKLLTQKGVKFMSTWAGRSSAPRPAAQRAPATAAPRRSLAKYPGLSEDPYMKTTEDFRRVIATFAQYRACAVLRTPTKELAPKAMEAAVSGGFKICEFTLTTPGVHDTLSDFRAKHGSKVRPRRHAARGHPRPRPCPSGLRASLPAPRRAPPRPSPRAHSCARCARQVMVGMGTVLSIEDAKQALDAGAEFILAPILVPEVVTFCAMRNIVVIPGCQTPTEAFAAYQAGAPIQKIFPGVAGAGNWIKAVSAALPCLSLNPTSGVDLDNAGDYLRNGAFGVGLVVRCHPWARRPRARARPSAAAPAGAAPHPRAPGRARARAPAAGAALRAGQGPRRGLGRNRGERAQGDCQRRRCGPAQEVNAHTTCRAPYRLGGRGAPRHPRLSMSSTSPMTKATLTGFSA